jgi:hypothetical protein
MGREYLKTRTSVPLGLELDMVYDFSKFQTVTSKILETFGNRQTILDTSSTTFQDNTKLVVREVIEKYFVEGRTLYGPPGSYI